MKNFFLNTTVVDLPIGNLHLKAPSIIYKLIELNNLQLYRFQLDIKYQRIFGYQGILIERVPGLEYQIEISTAYIFSPKSHLQTLIHEMCHLAQCLHKRISMKKSIEPYFKISWEYHPKYQNYEYKSINNKTPWEREAYFHEAVLTKELDYLK